jgi:hypothetical protein
MRTITKGKTLLKEPQKLHSKNYGRYFGYCTLSYIFKNVTRTTPSRVLKNGTDMLCRNVGKKLPIYEA